jgi:hypothetical protein
MRFRTLILGLAGALLSAHVSWAQLDTETPAQPSLDPKQISAPFVPGELVVGLESGDFALPLVAMEMVGTITAQNPPIQSFVIKLAPNLTMQDAGEFLRTVPGVRYVEPNYLAFAFATPNDPDTASSTVRNAFRRTSRGTSGNRSARFILLSSTRASTRTTLT